MVDPGSFLEAGPMVGAAEFDDEGNLIEFTPGAYVMGLAEIDGRPVAIGGDDFTISGGSPHNVRKHSRQFTQPLATQYGIPYIQLVEGVGHSAKADEASGHMGLPGGDLWWKGVELLTSGASRCGRHGFGRRSACRICAHVPLHRDDKRAVPDIPVRSACRAPRYRGGYGQGGAWRTTSATSTRAARLTTKPSLKRTPSSRLKTFISYLPNTTNDVAPRVETGDPPDRRPEELLNIIPPNRQSRLRPPKADQTGGRQWQSSSRCAATGQARS